MEQIDDVNGYEYDYPIPPFCVGQECKECEIRYKCITKWKTVYKGKQKYDRTRSP